MRKWAVHVKEYILNTVMFQPTFAVPKKKVAEKSSLIPPGREDLTKQALPMRQFLQATGV